MWVSVGPCSLSEDAQEIFVWHPTLHGPLSVCLCRRRQWSFSQAFGHWLGEIFTISCIFFCRIQTKTQEEEATTTYMHSIAYYYYNYFNVHTTERLPPPTRRFFMPQDYLQFLLSTRIIMQSLLLLLLTTLYYCHFWKKTFLESHKCSFFVILKD